jgi:hypothetical protein
MIQKAEELRRNPVRLFQLEAYYEPSDDDVLVEEEEVDVEELSEEQKGRDLSMANLYVRMRTLFLLLLKYCPKPIRRINCYVMLFKLLLHAYEETWEEDEDKKWWDKLMRCHRDERTGL